MSVDTATPDTAATDANSVNLAGAVEAAVTPTNPTGAHNGNPATPADTATPTDSEPAESTNVDKTFTQAEVDELIKQRLGRQEKKFAKEIADLKQAAEMTPDEAATHKAELLEKTNTELTAELAKVRVDYAVRLTALTNGVPADQTDAITRLADLDGLTTDTGDVDTEKVNEAVAAVLAKYPGLTGTPKQPASDPVGSGPATADPVRKQPENLMDAVLQKFGG